MRLISTILATFLFSTRLLLADTEPARLPGQSAVELSRLPTSIDLRPDLLALGLLPRQQGQRPTCSVFTMVGALEFAAAKRQSHCERLSIEFLNWAANQACGDDEDGGFFSDLWKGFAKYGICTEEDMPYQPTFLPTRPPSAAAITDAKIPLALGLRLHWIKEWNVNTGLTEDQFFAVKRTLQEGWPVCGGFRWPKQEQWEKEVLQMCPTNAVRDGHSVLLVGYHDDTNHPSGGVFLFRNTSRDGRDGAMPYAYAQAFMNDSVWVDYQVSPVIDANGQAPTTPAAADLKPILNSFDADSGRYHFTIDATAAPDLMEWAQTELQPVVEQWYPKLVAMLPSDDFQARTNVTLRFRNDMGGTPASAGGAGINLNSGWFRKELKREARGSVVHEMVHVIQSYGRASRTNPNATRAPGWLVEGMADYIRWFLYEPETHGAEITQRNISRAKYDASYRITGNFLNWVTHTYDPSLVRKLNAAAREGNYSEQLWKELTGKTVQELGDEWLKANQVRLENAEPKPSAPSSAQ